MGIKNLKSLLLTRNSLSQICAHGPRESVFVDFMGAYIAAAYSVSNVAELKSAVVSKLHNWRTLGARVTLFVDRGQIAIKTPIRQQRRANLKAQQERKRAAVADIERHISELDATDEFYEEARAGLEEQLNKSRFFMFLAEDKNLYRIMDEILSTVPEWVSVVHCDDVDAEFEMCARARDLARTTKEWPILFSHDQDTLCLSHADLIPKIVYFVDTSYMLRPCAYGIYMVKLTLLINGCDFLPGLRGVAISPATLQRFRLFRKFTVANVVRTLVFRNYNIANCASADVAARLAFIDRYVALDRSLYANAPPPKIAVHDFLSSALLPYWRAACGDRVREESPLLEKIHAVLVMSSGARGDRDVAAQMLEHYRDEKPTRACVQLFVHAMGARVCEEPGVLAVCMRRMDVFLSYGDGEFFFNDRAIIENGEGLLNISL